MNKYYRRQNDSVLYQFKNKTPYFLSKPVRSSSLKVELPEHIIFWVEEKDFLSFRKENEFDAIV